MQKKEDNKSKQKGHKEKIKIVFYCLWVWDNQLSMHARVCLVPASLPTGNYVHLVVTR